MTVPFPDNLDTPENLHHYLQTATEGLMLVNRKLQVIQINNPLKRMVGKPDPLGLTFGQVLSCIHIGDHPDGCGYGSICDDCFIHQGIRQAFRTKIPVYGRTGKLPVGLGTGVNRVSMHINTIPFMQHNQRHVLVSVVFG